MASDDLSIEYVTTGGTTITRAVAASDAPGVREQLTADLANADGMVVVVRESTERLLDGARIDRDEVLIPVRSIVRVHVRSSGPGPRSQG